METVLYSFRGFGLADGAEPNGGVLIGPGGSLYGATYYGGTNNGGTVYELAPPSSPSGSWTETLLHSFSLEHGKQLPGPGPMVTANNGALYGSTNAGGARH
jgi:uncharacterized repeat protein (TIGR03803 family)